MNSTFTKIVRYLLALMLLVFGLNKFLKLLPMPELPPSADGFMPDLAATGYVLPVVGAIEIFIGILLLINKWTPIALVLLAPISVNILLFHLFLDLPGIGGAFSVAILNGILIYKHWSKFRPLFA